MSSAAGALLRRTAFLLGEILAQTCALIAPRECPCGREGAWLCRDCALLLEAPPTRVDSVCDALQLLSSTRVREEDAVPAGTDHRPLLPVLAIGEYAGPLQSLVLAWKNGGMLHLGPHLASALVPAVEALACETRETAASSSDPVLLIPVPSRRSARLRRGEDHVAELVREIAARGGGRALVLRASPTTAQEGGGSRQRRHRRIRLGRGGVPEPLRGRAAVIVDDVVTTGATLRGMHEALTSAGVPVLGAVVIASARLPVPKRLPRRAAGAVGTSGAETR
ncbi:ComF family protein [Brachybacterium sp. DNPG3]